MFDSIFKHTDELGSEFRVIDLTVRRLVDETSGKPAEDPDGPGRLMIMAPKGSAALGLSEVANLRDALTEHLARFPEPIPVPIPA